MSGGFSHVDSFDPKPRLDTEAGQPLPMKVERTMFNQNGNIFPSPWKFNNYGESGIPVSDLFPHIGSCADDLAVIRSMTATFNEHAQANFFMHPGRPFAGFPSIGAWTTYGLGSENRNLPGFVVLGSGGIPLGGRNMFGNGSLPAIHQGSIIHPGREEPMNNVRPKEADRLQRKRLAFIDDIDREFLGKTNHPQVEAAIRNYETAYRMQAAVPELVDLSRETEARRNSTAWIRKCPKKPPTRRNACRPGGSSNAACDLSKRPSSITRACRTSAIPGTSTGNCVKATRRMLSKWTSRSAASSRT